MMRRKIPVCVFTNLYRLDFRMLTSPTTVSAIGKLGVELLSREHAMIHETHETRRKGGT